jgi:hypothetical protein
MTGGRGRRGQVPNEEDPFHEHCVQDMMIEDVIAIAHQSVMTIFVIANFIKKEMDNNYD